MGHGNGENKPTSKTVDPFDEKDEMRYGEYTDRTPDEALALSF